MNRIVRKVAFYYQKYIHFIFVVKISVSNLEETEMVSEETLADVKKEQEDKEWEEMSWTNPRFSSLQGYLEGNFVSFSLLSSFSKRIFLQRLTV